MGLYQHVIFPTHKWKHTGRRTLQVKLLSTTLHNCIGSLAFMPDEPKLHKLTTNLSQLLDSVQFFLIVVMSYTKSKFKQENHPPIYVWHVY